MDQTSWRLNERKGQSNMFNNCLSITYWGLRLTSHTITTFTEVEVTCSQQKRILEGLNIICLARGLLEDLMLLMCISLTRERKPRSIIRWDWTTSRTAIAVAHALAHNLGVRHDFDLGAGLHDSCEHREWTEETIRNHASNCLVFL
eukprot:GFUD01102901.1.p1 GENE.GFUD01102901.1~~GFUD01102901.1.p1  ORF type:complete len:146 (-),score=13.88 GFUD01102901.1:46-483(-)